MKAKRCPVCGLHFPKPKYACSKDWEKQETCSNRCAAILRERRKKKRED